MENKEHSEVEAAIAETEVMTVEDNAPAEATEENEPLAAEEAVEADVVTEEPEAVAEEPELTVETAGAENAETEDIVVEETVEELPEEKLAEKVEEAAEVTEETTEETAEEEAEAVVEEKAAEKVVVEEIVEEVEAELVYELTDYIESAEHRSGIALVIEYFKNVLLVFFWAILTVAAVVGFVASIVISASAPAAGLVVFGNCLLITMWVVALIGLVYYVVCRIPISIIGALILGLRVRKQKYDDIATVATIKILHEKRNCRSALRRAFTLYPYIMDKKGKVLVVLTDIFTYLLTINHLSLLSFALTVHFVTFLFRAYIGEPLVLVIGVLGLIICGVICFTLQLARDIIVATVKKRLIRKWSKVLEGVQIQ